MKYYRIQCLCLLLLFLSCKSKAQSPIYVNFDEKNVRPLSEIQSGAIQNLDQVDSVDVIFDYSALGVDAFRKEEDYLANIQKGFQTNVAGWEKYKLHWEKGKQENYPLRFIESFNKSGPRRLHIVACANDTSHKHKFTLIVKPSYLATQSSWGNQFIVDAEYIFKTNHGSELMTMYCKNAIGKMPNFKISIEYGIAEAFAESAKILISGIRRAQR